MFRTIIVTLLISGLIIQGAGLAIETPPMPARSEIKGVKKDVAVEISPPILGFFYIKSMADLSKKMNETALVKISKEIQEMIAAEKRDDPDLKEAVKKSAELMVLLDLAQSAFTGEIFVAAYGKSPKLGLAANVNPEKFKKLVTGLCAFIKEEGAEISFTTGKDSGSIKLGGLEIVYKISEGELAIAANESEIKNIKAVEKSFRKDAEYARAIKKIGTDNDVVAFVDAVSALQVFGRAIEPEPRKVLEQLGILNIESLIISQRFVDGGLLSKTSLAFKDSDKGIFELFASAGVGPTVQKYIPKNHNCFFRIKLAGFMETWNLFCANFQKFADERDWKEFQKNIEGFKEETGLDLVQDILAPLGGELSISAAIPEMLGIPLVLVFLEVKDSNKFDKTLKQIFEKANLEFISSEYKGYKINTTIAPLVQPSYSFRDNYLIVALAPATLREALTLEPKGSLLEKTEYKSVRSRLPEKGTMEEYLEIDKIVNLGLHFAGMKLAQGGADPLFVKMMGKIQSAFIEPWPVGTLLTSDRDSITSYKYEERGLILSSVAGTAILAGMLLPALSRARGRARQIRCMTNLKQIFVAIEMYRNDYKGKYPEKLSALHPNYIALANVFVCPTSKEEVISATDQIDSRTGYLYRKPNTEDNPGAIPMLCDRPGNHGRDGVNIAFGDGHVQWRRLTNETIKLVNERFGQNYNLDTISSSRGSSKMDPKIGLGIGAGAMALLALSSSGTVMPMMLVGVGVAVPALARARKAAKDTVCLSNIKQLLMAQMMYSHEHDEKYAEKPAELYPNYIPSFRVFVCPQTKGDEITGPSEINGKCSYLFRPGASSVDDPNSPVIRDKFDNHQGEFINVGYNDGSAGRIPLTTEVREKFSKIFKLK